jgi:hypothetical protein
VPTSDDWQDARKGKWRITLQMKGTLLVFVPTYDGWPVPKLMQEGNIWRDSSDEENLWPFCPPLMSGNKQNVCRGNKEGLFLR